MTIGNTALVLRRRGGWEAMDAGILLYRRFAGHLYLRLATLYIPVAVGLGVFFPERLIWIAFLIVWWLKPLWGRLALHPIATGFFRPEVTRRELRRGFIRSLASGLLGDLTWRRFSPWRSFTAPARALEGLRGSAGRRRLAVLGRDGRGFAFSLTAILLCVEVALLVGETAFFLQLQSLMPELIRWHPDLSTPGVWRVLYGFFAAHVLLFEPLHVAMGFGLYINRRVELEGWDLEVAFRAAGSPPRGAGFESNHLRGATVFLLALLLVSGVVRPAMADQVPVETPLAELRAVLDSPDFGYQEERTVLRWREDNWENLVSTDDVNGFQFDLFAVILKWALIVAGASALLHVLWRNRNLFHAANSPARSRDRIGAPQHTARPTCPDHPEAAEQLFADGAVREAWAMVYRGLVDGWSDRFGTDFGPQATEGDCLQAVRVTAGMNPELTGWIDDFEWAVRHWQRVAYAHDIGEENAAAFAGSVALLRRLVGGEAAG